MGSVAYIDESGDHNLQGINPQFPVLTVVAFILKDDHIHAFEEKVRTLKESHFGSDDVILHSSEIRKQLGPFKVLQKPNKRERFFDDLSQLIIDTPCVVTSISIDKARLIKHYITPDNPYILALESLIESIIHWSTSSQGTSPVQLIAESRGNKEDRQ